MKASNQFFVPLQLILVIHIIFICLDSQGPDAAGSTHVLGHETTTTPRFSHQHSLSASPAASPAVSARVPSLLDLCVVTTETIIRKAARAMPDEAAWKR